MSKQETMKEKGGIMINEDWCRRARAEEKEKVVGEGEMTKEEENITDVK